MKETELTNCTVQKRFCERDADVSVSIKYKFLAIRATTCGSVCLLISRRWGGGVFWNI